MNDESQPTNAELLHAILALHGFTEAGLQRLDGKIDGLDGRIDRLEGRVDGLDGRIDQLDGRVGQLDAKIDILRFDMNTRFDRVYDDLDELKTRVARLEHHPT